MSGTEGPYRLAELRVALSVLAEARPDPAAKPYIGAQVRALRVAK
jgi:hypothetical protein